MSPAAIGTTPPTPHTRLTSTRAPQPHGTPQEQPAARSGAISPPETPAKDSRAKEHGAVTARGPMPPTAISNTAPTPHTRLTSTRAPQPHGTPQEQQAAQPEAFSPPEALARDRRAKEHDAVKARGPTPPAAIGTTPPLQKAALRSRGVWRQGQAEARENPGQLARVHQYSVHCRGWWSHGTHPVLVGGRQGQGRVYCELARAQRGGARIVHRHEEWMEEKGE